MNGGQQEHSGVAADALAACALVALTWTYAVFHLGIDQYPTEDAAILMRYADHLARGHGLVWNVGEHPVDGATDFLFTVAVALLARVGLPLQLAVRALTVTAHSLTIIIVYLTVTRMQRGGRGVALASAAYLAVGPGVLLTLTYFGTPFFVLFVSLSWCLSLALRAGPTPRWVSGAFAASSLVMGLVRPEGVFLALLMLLVVVPGAGNRRQVLRDFALTFLLVGGAYFAWRWWYFGYPFPNPYYKKGGGTLYIASLRNSVSNVLVLCAPFLGVYILAVVQGRFASFVSSVPSLVVTGGFASVWILLSNEMNYAKRFQYPVLPVVLMSWASLLPNVHEPNGRRRWWRLATGLVLTAAALLYIQTQVPWDHSRGIRNGPLDVGNLLASYREHGYTLAASEAGLLPFYSGWRTIDTWGLNDPWIAHHEGIVTESYLQPQRPEVIMFLACFALDQGLSPTPFIRMGLTLKSYAERNGYVLAGAFGPNQDCLHYYYVRSDFPESAAIVAGIRSIDYRWQTQGQPSRNFALEPPP